jgi:hypothetical protein
MSDHVGELTTTWMFQYNPYDYKLDEELKQTLTEPWTIFWGRSVVQLGERIYFMRSGGPTAAITAVGRVVSQMYEKPEEESRYLRYWVNVVYDYRVDPPLIRDPEMLRDALLSQYRPYAKGEFRANFALPPEIAAHTERMVKGRLHPIERMGRASHKRIFVSHSHFDNDFGMRLVADLRAALGGREDAVWYDASGGLHGGDEWWKTIRHEMEQRPVVIVIVSPESKASDWVNRELDMAVTQDKHIIPVLFKPCQVRIDLARYHYVSFVSPVRYEDALQELLVALGLAG